MIFLVVLPSTIQSSIAFTTVARGNVAGAVTSAAFSNIVGLVLTPVLLTLLAGTREAAPSLSAIWSIVSELLLPFVIGHLMRPLLISWIERHKRIVTLNDRGTIVLAVYSAFSSAVVAGLWHIMPPGEIAKLALVCAVLLTSGLCLSAGIATLLGFSREDCIAIMFCGSKKTLASGVPMARVLFPVADVGVILLPIMIYHQIQLMVCASIASRLGRSAPVGEGGAFDPA